ncbi:hypothetical protein QU481_21910 [Crenobacter sp. SG2303]|uniref:Sodium:proline symporter n=1 Tax=Crenobacter oryzisoli TaxID=3056844 RepID=A0ABT7XUR8_9NEIS|nr:hypothetical protein [Crenobacter sp. SG2303]MDN0077483.1 hypothetical protein [Crenobacter sp. SG2303]
MVNWFDRRHGILSSASMQAVLVGITAGTLATVAQLLLWWLEGTPVLATLLRDARLTAAILLGRDALAPQPGWPWRVLLVATLIHFALSVGYAALALAIAGRLHRRMVLLGGALYGLGIYAVNLYGFTALFPWFVVSRGAVTLLAHLVFGIVTLGGAWLLRPPEPGMSR